MTPLALDVGDALADIAAALEYPVLIAAVIALLLCALELGAFFVELARRVRVGRGMLRKLARQTLASPGHAHHFARQAPSRWSAEAIRGLGDAAASGSADAFEDVLADFELTVQRRLDRTRILVRSGPAIGLMGTLIPLAPGLTALSRGDVQSLALDLRTAFGATVIGLLVGTVAFALTLYRTRAASEDLHALERAIAEAGRS